MPLDPNQVKLLTTNLVNKNLLSLKDKDNIDSSLYKDFYALEASLYLDYFIPYSAISIKYFNKNV